jgi:SH3 domain protein
MKVLDRIIWFTLIWFVFVFTGVAVAETLYVIDQLVITVRRGKSAQHAVIKTVKTGTPLEVLESVKGEPYVKVRLQSGEEGYVLRQYLSNKTPKSVIIARLQKEVGQLRNKLEEVESKRGQLADDLKTIQKETSSKEEGLSSYASGLETELTRTKQDLQSLKEKYDTLLDKSKKVMEISSERDSLLENNRQLISEVRLLRDEKSRLMRSGMIKWFLAGGGVFFFGWFIGKISRKKKQGLTI